jgi:YegS/Rv2252/BmrU family lipid kinase
LDVLEDQSESLIIVNPAAGGGKAGREWPSISTQLTTAGLKHEAVFTQGGGDATVMCRDALQRGVRRVIVVGGDGTLNETANGFFDENGVPSRPIAQASLGIIPLGTGSDFARSLGIKRGARAIPTLLGGVTVPIDVGLVTRTLPNGHDEQRIFVNVADVGIGAETARRVNEGGKRLGPALSYLVGAVQAINRYHPSLASITVDDAPGIEQLASIIVVANLRYFGGGMQVAPRASYEDGLFDLLWVGGASKRRLMFDLLPRVYAGKHLGHPQVNMRRASRISIMCQPPLPLEVDGEPFGTTPATFTLVPGILPVIVPS